MTTSDLDRQIEKLRKCELITEEEVKKICAKAREILVEESNTQRVDSPVTVCGVRDQLECTDVEIHCTRYIKLLPVSCDLLCADMWRYSWAIL